MVVVRVVRRPGGRACMDSDGLNERLSRIKTRWTELLQAHGDEGNRAAETRRQLLLRYHGAVYRYLLGALRDADQAEELAQDFAVRFLRGDFKRADPQRGRFRDFLKTALRNLLKNHWKAQAKL